MYGFASLSCTLPIFLSIAMLALSQGVEGLVALLAYGLGMGLVLTAASMIVALGKESLLRSWRKARAYLEPLGAALLLIAGSYLFAYWLFFLLHNGPLADLSGLLGGCVALLIGLRLRGLRAISG
jgi:cytochrome c-type biogenesis protein